MEYETLMLFKTEFYILVLKVILQWRFVYITYQIEYWKIEF